MMVFSVPPGYRRSRAPKRPKLDPFTAIIDQILEADRTGHTKQLHTSKRIFERLRDEYGYRGGMTIVKDYPAESTEAFCAGHTAAFQFFGKVPKSILYDNTKIAVARILGDGKRQRTRVFSELQSHYLFLDRFGRPGKGNDKGKVEGLVGYIRRNFLVPVPRATSFAALNAK